MVGRGRAKEGERGCCWPRRGARDVEGGDERGRIHLTFGVTKLFFQQNSKFALTVSITVGLNCNRDGSTVDGFMNAFRSLMSNSVFFAMHMAHKSSHHSDGKKT